MISPLHAFGLQNDVQNNVLAVDESTILHPVGRAIALYNVDSRKMAFIREGTQDRGETTALALSPSKKYLAVCERAETAQLSIYHVGSQKKTKVLPAGGPLPDSASDRFVTAAFSADSKLLAAVTGDCSIALWLWDKGRLLAFQKNPSVTAITRLSFDPREQANSSTICTSGPKFLRLWRLSDGQLKPAPGSSLSKREPPGVTPPAGLASGEPRIMEPVRSILTESSRVQRERSWDTMKQAPIAQRHVSGRRLRSSPQAPGLSAVRTPATMRHPA